MSSLVSTQASPTSTPVKLNLAFYGNGVGSTLYPAFNDGSSIGFSWDPTTPYSSVQYSQCYAAPVTTLPNEYLNAVIMLNVGTDTWAWPSMTGSLVNTFSAPAGYLTLYGLMQALYTSTQSTITFSQYQDITGFEYQGSSTPTIAAALKDYAESQMYTPQLQWITRESSNVLRIVC